MSDDELLKIVTERYEYRSDGHLYYKIRLRGLSNKTVGTRAGNKHPDYGYITLKILGKYYKEHCLVWLLHNGKLPYNEIDHINNVEDDNRIENLRAATRETNCANRKGWGKSGFKGVSRYKREVRWLAYIRCNGVRYTLGRYNTKEEAARAYDRAAIKLHGEFALLNFSKEDYEDEYQRNAF